MRYPRVLKEKTVLTGKPSPTQWTDGLRKMFTTFFMAFGRAQCSIRFKGMQKAECRMRIPSGHLQATPRLDQGHQATPFSMAFSPTHGVYFGATVMSLADEVKKAGVVGAGGG